MKNRLPCLFLSLFLAGACTSSREISQRQEQETFAHEKSKRQLIKVAEIEGAQLTGVSVSRTGRVFVNFPRWRDNIPFSVAEVMPNGSFKPYPNEEWNSWKEGQRSDNQFVCVQSVVVGDDDYLWVLDPSSPELAGVIDEGAKLVKFDLGTNQAIQSIRFDKQIAPKQSYLNDLRIDTKNQKIYMTCSGKGAIVVVDLQTGKVRRLLEHHASTDAEDIVLTIDGKELRFANGQAPRIHSDGIAWDQQNDYLYYHALTAYHLYRIKTRYLLDEELSEEELGKQVEDLGKTPAPDGMILDKKGNLFMADLENNAIVYRTREGAIKTLLQDDELRWVDTFSLGQDGFLYFTCSHIHETEWFFEDADVENMTFEVYKIGVP
jgi:sugar lactone lactonase YvrE